MADKNIKKETKKKKKTDPSKVSYSAPKPAIVQPELIKKVKKIK